MESNETIVQIENRKNEKGVTTVEYAIMLILVAIAVAATDPGISAAVTGAFSEVASLLAIP